MTDYELIAGESWPRGGGFNEVFLEDGKDFWPGIDDCEVRAHVRAGKTTEDDLILDLSPKLQKEFVDNDIRIYWTLTGAETRQPLAGFYDLFISDVGATDAKAIKLDEGKIKVKPSITTGAGV